ncbi:MAG: excinuclease ABC subunit UvrC, partial [SAR324 cluster bacterium]|nr:excinuclease ABC subunit UvrC [SAR324 cluster bacterium]
MAKQVQESGKASWDDSPIREKLQHLPDASGVYQFRSVSGDILYIGKAKSLRQRVRSYFQPSANHTLRIQIMVSLVHDVTLIVTDTEAEALILEEQLIKSHRPRYNVLLKDDKSYPFCKLTVNERYPRLFLVREKHDPKAEYYGPYPSVKDARQVLRMVSRHFPLRTSKMVLDGTKAYRPCLNFQLHRCLAPCRGTVEVSEYQQVVNHVRMFLRGRDKELMGDLEADMQEASEQLDFERAATIRDQIQALRRVFERQMVLSTKGEDQDVLNLYREAESSVVQVLFIRNGRLLGTDCFYESGSSEASDDNLLGLVLNRLYTGEAAHIPREILLPFPYSDQQALEEALNRRAERRVYVSVPKKGRKRELVMMAFNNAKFNLTEQHGRLERESNVLAQVQRFLRLRKSPETVEAFDISHLSGTMTVASLVCWRQNHPHKE